MKSLQLLPPKMLAQYADRARKGDYQHRISDTIYHWFVGNQLVTVILSQYSDHAVGHVQQLTIETAARRKLELTRAQEAYECKKEMANG